MRKILFFCLLTFASLVLAIEEPIMTQLQEPVDAVDFTLPDINQDLIKFSDHKGKYILVNFWAMWCPPCIKEFPSMQTLYETLGSEDLEIIAVHAGPVEGDIQSFLQDNNISFKVLIDKDVIVKGWKVAGLPISYLVNPEGQIIYQAIGPREWDAKLIQELMGKD